MSVRDFKANFSKAYKSVLAGEEIAIQSGRKKEIIAKLVPTIIGKRSRRKLGIFDGRGKIKFTPDYKITEEDFLSL